MPARSRPVLFVCLHGSAKSLIAVEHFNLLARSRGLDIRAESSGLEPDEEVPRAVVGGLAASGIEVGDYKPRQLTREHLQTARRIVSFGCELALPPGTSGPVEHWN